MDVYFGFAFEIFPINCQYYRNIGFIGFTAAKYYFSNTSTICQNVITPIMSQYSMPTESMLVYYWVTMACD